MEGTATAIRLNPFKGADGPQGVPVPWSPWGRMLPERPVFTLDPLLHAGCYYVQDSSAMFPAHLLRTQLPAFEAPVRVLDLCAAPGGKTTDIAASLQSENYLLRVFAYLDRRVGKRTLVKIRDDVEKLPEWVKQFYNIRCEAEGIRFQPDRTADACAGCRKERSIEEVMDA